MKINRYVSDLMFSNMYLLTENGHSIIIDPWIRCKVPDQLCMDFILVTHEHYDHISGVNRFKDIYHTPLLCSRSCGERISDSRKNMARYFEAFSQIQTYGEQDSSVQIDTNYTCKADIVFEQRISFEWQGNKICLREMPGHSPGSIGIMINDSIFFSGDSLLPDREVELRFPGGSKDDWEEQSAKIIESLSDDVKIYPGHRHDFVMKQRRNHGVF